MLVRESMLTGFGSAFGLILPLAFLLQLDSYLLHQSTLQVAMLYMAAAAGYLILILVASCLVWGFSALGRSIGRIALVVVTAAWIALASFVLWTAVTSWHDTLTVPNVVTLYPGRWALLFAAAVCLIWYRPRRTPLRIDLTKALSVASRTLTSIRSTLVMFGSLFLVVAFAIALVGLLSDTTPRSLVRLRARADGLTTHAVSHPDVYLITLDAMTASDMSLYGYGRATTPNIEAFARNAYVFDRYYAASNYTTPTVHSMLTGLLPWTHRVYHIYGLPYRSPETTNLPQELRVHGYRTAAFVSNGLAHPIQQGTAPSFDYVSRNYLNMFREHVRDRLQISYRASFQSLIDLCPIPAIVDWIDARRLSKRSLDGDIGSTREMLRDALAYTRKYGGQGKPLFVWTHIYAPHHPYLPPRPYMYRFLSGHVYDTFASQDGPHRFFRPNEADKIRNLRARYDENIAWADAMVGDYLAKLNKEGRLENAVVIITSDHGESFAHGYWGHLGPDLTEDLIHIPLVIRLPQQQSGRRIDDVVSQTDLFPTIVDLVGITVPERLDGRSVKCLLESCASTLPPRPAIATSLLWTSVRGFPRTGTVALLDGRYKLVTSLDAGTADRSVFDVVRDPSETSDLSRVQPHLADELGRALHGAIDAAKRRSDVAQ